MMKILVTCPFGLSSLLGSELKRLSLKPQMTFERGVLLETDWRGIYLINLWSRIANKVYLHLGEEMILTFDQLFDFLQQFPWQEYLNTIEEINVQVVSNNSLLHSLRALQSIAHKSILTAFQKKHPGVSKKSPSVVKKDILIRFENNLCQVFVNTSGASLHERGWRESVGAAPLKENLAAGLVLLSGWKFQKLLLDPFCGSGTLLIEAAMIAKNIAPGLQRIFAFESFSTFDPELLKTLRQEAKAKQFDGNYQLVGYDQDGTMEKKLLHNARKAHVADCIRFEKRSFSFQEIRALTREDFRIVSNPPYGKRLKSESLLLLYQDLGALFQASNVYGGIISSYFAFENTLKPSSFSKKKVYNGGEECRFWWKK